MTEDMMVPIVWWREAERYIDTELVPKVIEVFLCDSCALRAPDAKRCDEREAAREVARGTCCDDCGGEL